MNKRIKTVWILSIATMALILCGQAYWLVSLYKYAIGLNIEKLKTECTKAVEQEELYRFYLSERDSVETPKTHALGQSAFRRSPAGANSDTARGDFCRII